MDLDIRVLELFHRMAREGVDSSAARLNQIEGVDARVAVTRIQFVTPHLLGNSLADTKHLAVNVGLSGGITGQSFVVFQHDVANNLTSNVEASLTGDDTSSDSSDEILQELGHIMNAGFIDGWADVLGTTIDVTPPRVTTGRDSEALFGEVDTFDNSEIGIVFRSQIQIDDISLSFQHYLFPHVDDLDSIIRDDRDTGTQFGIEKIHGFDQMVKEGAEQAANKMSSLTGVDTRMSVRNLNFIPVGSIPEGVPDDDVVGVAFAYNGLPSGYMAFVFEEDSAESIVSEMVHDGLDDPLEGLGKSALEELGNIMASGLIDGWADVLNTMVNHSTPQFVRETEDNLMDSLVAQVDDNQEYAFLFDTTVEAENESFDCKIYSVCEEGDLESALAQMDMDSLEDVTHVPSFPFDEESAD